MGEEIREKLLESGMHSMRTHGYDAVSIRDIVEGVGVPRGSFHHYFTNKEVYTLQVLDRFEAYVRRLAAGPMKNPGLSPLQKLRAFYQAYGQAMGVEKYQRSCLSGMLALEISDRSEILRERAERGLATMEIMSLRLLRKARACGEIRKDLEPARLAGFIVNSWEGALLRMKVQKSGEPLEEFDRMIFIELLGVNEYD